ncbi:HAMP domain-containing histidine kinase [Myxococcota bacterium]|jgi:signal transduction histidine kinase|nr:HAMP domain-containing histidine kinase [Myxococcota bacterium]
MDTLRVLVVDDEAGIRMAVERALRTFTIRLPDVGAEFGLTFQEAASGEEALEAIRQSAPDILLLDYKMPGISGLDLMDRLRADGIDILTIVITAYASLETAVAATKRGGFDFLAKPFAPDELKSVLFKAAKHLVVQREARRLAEERKRVRFELLSVVAHEMKAPTAAIENYLRMMQDRVLGEDLSAYDRPISRAIARLEGMRKLVTDLLDLTRIESGSKARNVVDLDVREVAAAAVENARELATDQGISVELAPGPAVPMRADRGEIELILNNLLSNAVKYNRDHGRVDVSVARQDGAVVLTVRDTGIGMTAEECGRLFGEFVRIKNEKTRFIEGSGLGLSIVRKLVHLYGGEVTVASTPDVGSTFTVTLPVPG